MMVLTAPMLFLYPRSDIPALLGRSPPAGEAGMDDLLSEMLVKVSTTLDNSTYNMYYMIPHTSQKSGFLIINKPKGITSFGVVAQLRKITGIKKIGHAGTLDPLATGVLICAVGREATREIGEFLKQDKKYRATIRLGAVSSTYDAEGEIQSQTRLPDGQVSNPPAGRAGLKSQSVAQKDIENIIKKFIGTIQQVPPIYSAKKIGGKRAYQLAREGKEVVLKPSEVTIYAIGIVSYRWPNLVLDVHCSSGTYIRSLAHDIGQTLGVGGYIEELERTAIGSIVIRDAVDLNDLAVENWREYLRNEL